MSVLGYLPGYWGVRWWARGQEVGLIASVLGIRGTSRDCVSRNLLLQASLLAEVLICLPFGQPWLEGATVEWILSPSLTYIDVYYWTS